VSGMTIESASSSSRPGVRRFHFRMTNRKRKYYTAAYPSPITISHSGLVAMLKLSR
jgi:hypothetical protein